MIGIGPRIGGKSSKILPFLAKRDFPVSGQIANIGDLLVKFLNPLMNRCVQYLLSEFFLFSFGIVFYGNPIYRRVIMLAR